MPESVVAEFVRALHDRSPGWEDLIHPDAEFALTAFEGRTIRGRDAIVAALNTGRARYYEPRADTVELLDSTTVMVHGSARYPLPGGGLAESRVYWLDEVRDGQIWRARGYTSKLAARNAYEADRTSHQEPPN